MPFRPFSAAETAARPPMHSSAWYLETVSFDEDTRKLIVDGEPLVLPLICCTLLLHLHRQAGEVVRKEELYDAMWPGRNVGDHALPQCIVHLRQRLGDRDGSIIRSVDPIGYQLVRKRPTESATPEQGLGLPG